MAKNVSLPTELHKYRTYETGMQVLKDKQFFLSPFWTFNDIYEALPAKFANINEGLAEIFKTKEGASFLKKLGFTNKLLGIPLIFYPGTIPAGMAALALAWFMSEKENGADAETKKQRQDIFYAMMKHAKACCFSETAYDNSMWDRYANGHKGMVISFNPSVIYWKNAQFLKVRYQEKRPKLPTDINSREQFLDFLAEKGHTWEHEKEWRLIDLDAKSRKLIHFDKRCITAIRLGMKMSKKHKEEALFLCRQQYPNVPVYQMALDYAGNSYNMIEEKIK